MRGSDHHPLPAGGRDWEHALHGTEYIVEEVDHVLEEQEEQEEKEGRCTCYTQDISSSDHSLPASGRD
ncbi:hypothetical protein DIPPA_18065 [Diplonema papillatum]|nr:hypothetical protein DIPPA_18065 [Diplonema papillatum]